MSSWERCRTWVAIDQAEVVTTRVRVEGDEVVAVMVVDQAMEETIPGRPVATAAKDPVTWITGATERGEWMIILAMKAEVEVAMVLTAHIEALATITENISKRRVVIARHTDHECLQSMITAFGSLLTETEQIF